MPPIPADADAPLDLETPGTASAAASAVRASVSSASTVGTRGIEEIEVRHGAGQHVRLGEAGEAVFRRGACHRHGALGERLQRLPRPDRWSIPKPAGGPQGRADRRCRPRIVPTPRRHRRGRRLIARRRAPQRHPPHRLRPGAPPPPSVRRWQPGSIGRTGRSLSAFGAGSAAAEAEVEIHLGDRDGLRSLGGIIAAMSRPSPP